MHILQEKGGELRMTQKNKKINCIVGIVFILLLIIILSFAFTPSENTINSTNTTIHCKIWDYAGGEEYGAIPDRFGDCMDTNDTDWFFSKDQMRMLSYYSNDTFNYTYLNVSYHLSESGHRYVDHIFFENGTEMTLPDDAESSAEFDVHSRFIGIGNNHTAPYFGYTSEESAKFESENY